MARFSAALTWSHFFAEAYSALIRSGCYSQAAPTAKGTTDLCQLAAAHADAMLNEWKKRWPA